MAEAEAEGVDEEGEKEECGGDDEGKTNKTNQQQKKKKKGDGDDAGAGKKKPAPLVLGVDLHCDGCARKVVKAVKAAHGVEGVAADVAAGTVTVSGKAVDPWDLKDRIEARTHKPVAFVSPPNPNPNPPKKKKKGDLGAECNKCPATDCKGNKAAGDEDKKKKKHNKEEEGATVVVLKMGLHCNGCIDRIRRTAHKIKGVREVKVDTAKEEVTVQGTMDAKALPDVLSRKLRRDVVPVPMAKSKDYGAAKKKQEGADDKQVAGEEQPQSQSQQGGGGGGGGKKKKKKQQHGGGEEAGEAAMVVEEQQQAAFPMAMMYQRVEMLHAPQMFSDENPNACAVM